MQNYNANQQHNKVVILFKASGEADTDDEYVNVLKRNGFKKVELVPVIDFLFINSAQLREKLLSVRYDAILLTSPRAVSAINKVLDSDECIRLWKAKAPQCFVVGTSTSLFVKELLWGLTPIGSQCGNSQQLLEFITSLFKNSCFPPKPTILFPCGNLRKSVLPDGLDQIGFDVDIVTVYKTIQHPQLDNNILKAFNLMSARNFHCQTSLQTEQDPKVDVLLDNVNDSNTVAEKGTDSQGKHRQCCSLSPFNDINSINLTDSHELTKPCMEHENHFEEKNILVFFSPSGVDNAKCFIKKYIDNLSEVTFIAFGPSTKEALLLADFKVSATLQAPSPENLLQTLNSL